MTTMNEIIKQLIERKSTRIFLDKKISQDDKNIILEATYSAPTAGNMQLYSIIEINNQDLKDKLAILCDNQSFIAKADWVLVYCADYYKWYNAFNNEGLNPRPIQEGDLLLSMQDAIIAAQNSVTAAYSLGIGSCYIGDIMENAETIIDLLDIPEHVYPCCMLVFGYPDIEHIEKKKPKRVDSKYVLFENKYHRLNKQELEDMLKPRAGLNDYHTCMEKFCNFKHNSDFSKEMQRSAKVYIDNFINKK